MLLILAGICFVLALLFFFCDRWFEHAGMNLMWFVRICLFLALAFIGLNFWLDYRNEKRPGPVSSQAASVRQK